MMSTGSQKHTDSIFALATPPGRAGIAVFKLSGTGLIKSLGGLMNKPLPASHQARLRIIWDEHKNPIDQGLVLFMKAPHSFTGEDVVELHIHGSLAVMDRLATRLINMGLRQAEPGEFTRRAFMNGRMDLTEVEGLADLIDSETDMQREQALRQMDGGLKRLYEGLKEKLLDILAYIEGEIDFPDEGDVPDRLAGLSGPLLSDVKSEMKSLLSDSERGARIRNGIHITILGHPNAGKSSIINMLAKKDIAIISNIPGTTRDILSTDIFMHGLPVCLFDTAGLRDSEEIIEIEGMRRAEQKAKDSDMRIWVHDHSAALNVDEVLDHVLPGDMIWINKCDLDGPAVDLSLIHI